MNICKQSLKDLSKLNNWPRVITDDMDEDEKEKIRKMNKKLEDQKKSFNPATFLKTLVSQKKNRLKFDGFDLDMTYITNYVVALGFPAGGIETSIRNKREDVIRFFRGRHGVNVKIYNLCIEKNKQYNQVDIPEFGYMKYPFCDH